MKKRIRKIISIIIIIIMIYCGYNAVGYLIRGLNGPKLLNDSITASFIGNYILSIVYIVLVIICIVILILIVKKRKK